MDRFDRRFVLAGAGAASLLALPGCATLPAFSLEEVIRRLLLRSSEQAFARMTADGGYWDNAVADIGLNGLLGSRGNVLSRILTSALVKDRLQDALADVAYEGSRRAAPIVADAVRTIGIRNALELVRGGPTAATGFLRGSMGTRLVDAMVPEIGEALRLSQEPAVSQLLASLTGVDVSGLTNDFANRVDDAIWREIGVEESAIRDDPESTGDPAIIATFGVAGQLR